MMKLGETIEVDAHTMLMPLVNKIVSFTHEGEHVKARIVGVTSTNRVQLKRVPDNTKE